MSIKNFLYSKESWSSTLREIKTFSKYGLITVSKHALEKSKVRMLNIQEIFKIISRRDTYIIQCHKKGTYNNNKDDVYVLLGKIKYKKVTKPIHIVISKHIRITGTSQYNLVTMYLPNDEYFMHHGQQLRIR